MKGYNYFLFQCDGRNFADREGEAKAEGKLQAIFLNKDFGGIPERIIGLSCIGKFFRPVSIHEDSGVPPVAPLFQKPVFPTPYPEKSAKISRLVRSSADLLPSSPSKRNA